MTLRIPPLPVITLATRVTLIRIAGIPVFAALLLRHFATDSAGTRIAALIVFVLIITTDALDGWLARSRGEESALGKFLDPMADKLLMLCAISLLTRPYQPEFQPQFPLSVALLILAREAFLFFGYFIIRHKNGSAHIQPRWSGKAATFLAAITIALILLPGSLPWIRAFSGATALCFAVSWIQYTRDGFAQMR